MIGQRDQDPFGDLPRTATDDVIRCLDSELYNIIGDFIKKGSQGRIDAFALKDIGLFDLCITDVVMPGMDGFTLAKQIKALKPYMPLIFLTAKKEQSDILEGFRLGADDYITKPFSMDELVMRIQAVYRRCSNTKAMPSSYQLGSFIFDSPRHLLVRGKEMRKLTSKEADLLLLLCENLGKTLQRSEALQTIWGEETYLNARSMDVYITKLRKYLKEDPDIELSNIHGVGFKLLVK